MPEAHIVRPLLFGPSITAFFTGKYPGAEKGLIARLAGIPEKDIFYPAQKHTDRIIVLEEETQDFTADAVITRQKGVLIGVQVADCVPVLIHDEGTDAIGAVHAGWRGTADGILKLAIKEMNKKFGSVPDNIKIAIGPAIRWCHYEVGEDVLLKVKAQTGEGNYYKTEVEKPYLDLPLANKAQALSMGVREENIWLSNECTYCGAGLFNSFRREKGTGRQGGFIGKLERR